MSKESIPLKLDPIRFAAQAVQIEGLLPINQLPRLSSSLFSNEGEVKVSLKFGVDQEGIRYIEGHYETKLNLQCQRCMESYIYEIIGDFASGIVSTEEEAAKLPKRYDPAMTKDGMLNVPDMIEDELIISLPIVPMHDPQNCQVKLPFAKTDSQFVESEKENPFKVIELLRKKQDSK